MGKKKSRKSRSTSKRRSLKGPQKARKVQPRVSVLQDLKKAQRGGKTAQYRCCACDYEYYFYPGPISPVYKVKTKRGVEERQDSNECPKCGNLYVKWLNYDSDFAPHMYITNSEKD